ncbi:MAG TPA: S-layer homology domain-containing protein [Candidatus Evtepia faecigallinarum]|nr:S-layer homology domain-containing protein [Candidatus Evtepia faecigallinarum]
MRKVRTRIGSILLVTVMLLSLMPATALAAEPTSADGPPTASGTSFFANGTPITITANAPSDADAEVATFNEFTATGTDAYISWNENGTTKYIGVGASTNKAYVFGGADGRTKAVSVESTSITMTGGTIWRLFGGNYGEENANTNFCSVVKGDVSISLSGGAVVKDLLHGAGARNTCVNGTITMEFDGVDLSDSSSKLYVNGGSWGNGNEGTRNIADGAMETDAVANKVIITAKDSNFYLLGGGGSGSTKVRSSSVTLNNCTLSSLYLGGINGEVEDSSIVATGCTIEDLSATNRGFVGTANVGLNDCDITGKLNFGAANGCFSTDSGTPDGSGITGSSVWNIDEATTVTAAQITPLVVRTGSSSNPTYATTYQNLTIQKAGTPISAAISDFSPVYTSSGTPSVTLSTFSVPEGSALKLSGVTATVAENNTLTNVGTIDMDAASKLTVDTGATFGQLGTVNGTVDGEGIINDDYVARIGTTGYASLQDAVNAVSTTEPATITLLKDTAGAGVVVNGTVQRNLTFDLDGHTYTITSGVGSTGTETNGFQLIKDNNITFKNGTIAANPAEEQQVKILIQNYSNLTLENVKLDGTGMTDYTGLNYTLSNNNGAINLNTGTTIIPRTADDIAMDVCWAASYENGARVTVNEGAVIEGNVELGLWGQDAYEGNQSVLTVNGGTITGELIIGKQTSSDDELQQVVEDLKPNITINGGSFGASVDKFIDDTDGAAAKVQSGDTHSYYASTEAALAAAKPGDTITDLKTAVDNTATLTLNYNDGGITTNSVYTVAKNTEVPLPTPTRTNYTFGGWSDGTNTYSGGVRYTVNADVTLTAQWSKNSTGGGGGGGGVTTYAVTLPTDVANGTIAVSPKNAAKGATVTLTVTPDEGYVLNTLTVTDKDGKAVELTKKSDTQYTFQMPASKVSVQVSFTQEEAPVTTLPFTDVSTNDWFYEAVAYAYENGMMNGVAEDRFAPASNLTRGMITQVLYNLEGNPPAGSGSFTDVADGQWYADAVNWAAANDIVGGYGNGKFGPENNITREQMAQILYNYAIFKGYDVSAQGDLSAFSDGAKTSDWALTAMQWAVGTGLLQGYNGNLNPTGTATRAEVAQIFMNFCENIVK